ncbi:hypothetical protein EQ875_03838 [Photobacterium damselae subsp. damselae]|nr:hypothetical protein EQ875_03838 [Photobacterium damselae subsp. damselae]
MDELRIKSIVLVLLLVLVLVLVFPIVILISNSIRIGDGILVNISFYEYKQLFFNMWGYLFKRTTMLEFFQAVYVHDPFYDLGNTLSQFFAHLLNGFIPSFLSPFYENIYNKTANNIMPTYYWGQDINSLSSEDLTLPGFLYYYFGFLSYPLSFLFGILYAYIYSVILRMKKMYIKLPYIIFFLMFTITFYRSGSLNHFTLFFKQSICFYLLLNLGLKIIRPK